MPFYIKFYLIDPIPFRVHLLKVLSNNMRRRDFISSTGAAAGYLAVVPAASAASARLSAAEFQRIAIAIKGGFGAGFSLRSAKRAKGRVTAIIEHNQNYLQVASTDLIDWSVLRATDM